MNGLIKVRGVSTEEITDWFREQLIPYKILPFNLMIPSGTGYHGREQCFAFRSRLVFNANHRSALEARFPRKESRVYYDYRALCRPNSPDYARGFSGLVEFVDGLVTVDTILSCSIEYPY